MPRFHVRLHGFSERAREVDVGEPATAVAVLAALGIRRDLVLVFADGAPVPDDAILAPPCELRVVRVVTGGLGGDAPIATVEMTRGEVDTTLLILRGRLAELERALQNVEETEGMDQTKWQARRMLEPQIEALSDLVLKLEGAARELRAPGGRGSP